MSYEARLEYLETIRQQYEKSTRKDRTVLLDEACRNCGYNRKYLIALFSAGKPLNLRKKRKRVGRKKKYDHPQLIEVLTNLLKASNLVCGKRLVAMIPSWLPWYEQSFAIKLDPEVHRLLLSISASTIDRILAKKRSQFTKRGLSTTKPGSLLKTHIPIKTEQWDESRPGYLEADTVAHCGSSSAGMFILTLNTVDIATGWSEQRAVWGKGKVGVQQQIADIESSLPFHLRGFDADNGSEFINWHLMNYFIKRKHPVDYTRSREYKKNDNAHIEEKNYTIVRQYFGYQRFDNPAIVQQMNDLYKGEWRLLLNFFVPSFKLLSKERQGSKIIKKYSSPLTPYERVISSPEVSRKVKKSMKEIRASLNPFLLERNVSESIKRILKHVRCGTPDCPYHD
jgi:hypothetical protein